MLILVFLSALLTQRVCGDATNVYGGLTYDTGVHSQFNIQSMLDNTNFARSANGNAPLALDKRLCASAAYHCASMAAGEDYEHLTRAEAAANPKQDLGWRLTQQGLSNIGCAENIWMDAGATDAKGGNEVYMNSPDHKLNILGPYNRVGFAVCQGIKGVYTYWVSDFGMVNDDGSNIVSESAAGSQAYSPPPTASKAVAASAYAPPPAPTQANAYAPPAYTPPQAAGAKKSCKRLYKREI